MRKMLSGVLVGLLVLSGVTGCRGGEEAAAAKPVAATSPATETTSAAEAAALKRERAELDAIVRFLEVYDAHGADVTVTEPDAHCMSDNVLDEVGIKRLRKAGALGPGLRLAPRPQRASFTREDSAALADAYIRCTDWAIQVVEEMTKGIKQAARKQKMPVSSEARQCVQITAGTTELARSVLEEFLQGHRRLAKGTGALLGIEASPCLMTPAFVTRQSQRVLEAVFNDPPSRAAACVGARASARVLAFHDDRMSNFSEVRTFGKVPFLRAMNGALTKAVGRCLDAEALAEGDVLAAAGDLPADVEACVRTVITKDNATRMVVSAYRTTSGIDELVDRVSSCG